MLSKYFREIPSENLEALEKLYRVKWPDTAGMYPAIKLITSRCTKFPEFQANYRLFVLSENWQSDGTFIIEASRKPWFVFELE